MKRHLYILTLVLTLTACKQSGTTTNNQQTDSPDAKVYADTSATVKKETASVRLSFKNVEDVIQRKRSHAWVERKDSSASLALYFHLGYKDTLAVSYSPECWLMYPYRLDGDKIVVYWDYYIDSKYDFDIVKAIDKIDRKYIGKPFMILELVNDTTLKATYPIPGLIRKINSSSKKRKFFPDKYVVSQKFYS